MRSMNPFAEEQANVDEAMYEGRGGHCEDAPCCGCCDPRGGHDSGMSKDDYMEIMSRPDYDMDRDFDDQW